MKIRAIGFVIKELANDEFIAKIHSPSRNIRNIDVICKKKENVKIKNGDTVVVEIESYESEKALITHKF